MVHLQNKFHTSKDAHTLLRRAKELAGQEIVVRDVRVSKKYIELDTSLPTGMDIDALLGRLAAIAPLASYEHVVERQIDKDTAIEHAVKLFNDEKYWGAHEALESVWKDAKGDEKNTLNGIILVAAAFVHDEKDEPEICLSILDRAKKKFVGTSGMYHGINIGRISDLISRITGSGKIERFTI